MGNNEQFVSESSLKSYLVNEISEIENTINYYQNSAGQTSNWSMTYETIGSNNMSYRVPPTFYAAGATGGGLTDLHTPFYNNGRSQQVSMFINRSPIISPENNGSSLQTTLHPESAPAHGINHVGSNSTGAFSFMQRKAWVGPVQQNSQGLHPIAGSSTNLISFKQPAWPYDSTGSQFYPQSQQNHNWYSIPMSQYYPPHHTMRYETPPMQCYPPTLPSNHIGQCSLTHTYPPLLSSNHVGQFYHNYPPTLPPNHVGQFYQTPTSTNFNQIMTAANYTQNHINLCAPPYPLVPLNNVPSTSQGVSTHNHNPSTHKYNQILPKPTTTLIPASDAENQVTVSLPGGKPLFKIPLVVNTLSQETSAVSLFSSIMNSPTKKASQKYRRGSSHLKLIQESPVSDPSIVTAQLPVTPAQLQIRSTSKPVESLDSTTVESVRANCSTTTEQSSATTSTAATISLAATVSSAANLVSGNSESLSKRTSDAPVGTSESQKPARKRGRKPQQRAFNDRTQKPPDSVAAIVDNIPLENAPTTSPPAGRKRLRTTIYYSENYFEARKKQKAPWKRCRSLPLQVIAPHQPKNSKDISETTLSNKKPTTVAPTDIIIGANETNPSKTRKSRLVNPTNPEKISGETKDGTNQDTISAGNSQAPTNQSDNTDSTSVCIEEDISQNHAVLQVNMNTNSIQIQDCTFAPTTENEKPSSQGQGEKDGVLTITENQRIGSGSASLNPSGMAMAKNIQVEKLYLDMPLLSEIRDNLSIPKPLQSIDKIRSELTLSDSEDEGPPPNKKLVIDVEILKSPRRILQDVRISSTKKTYNTLSSPVSTADHSHSSSFLSLSSSSGESEADDPHDDTIAESLKQINDILVENSNPNIHPRKENLTFADAVGKGDEDVSQNFDSHISLFSPKSLCQLASAPTENQDKMSDDVSPNVQNFDDISEELVKDVPSGRIEKGTKCSPPTAMKHRFMQTATRTNKKSALPLNKGSPQIRKTSKLQFQQPLNDIHKPPPQPSCVYKRVPPRKNRIGNTFTSASRKLVHDISRPLSHPKRRKISFPPQNFQTLSPFQNLQTESPTHDWKCYETPPQNLKRQSPPQNFKTPPHPQNLQVQYPPQICRTPSPPQNSQTESPTPNDWQRYETPPPPPVQNWRATTSQKWQIHPPPQNLQIQLPQHNWWSYETPNPFINWQSQEMSSKQFTYHCKSPNVTQENQIPFPHNFQNNKTDFNPGKSFVSQKFVPVFEPHLESRRFPFPVPTDVRSCSSKEEGECSDSEVSDVNVIDIHENAPSYTPLMPYDSMINCFDQVSSQPCTLENRSRASAALTVDPVDLTTLKDSMKLAFQATNPESFKLETELRGHYYTKSGPFNSRAHNYSPCYTKKIKDKGIYQDSDKTAMENECSLNAHEFSNKPLTISFNLDDLHISPLHLVGLGPYAHLGSAFRAELRIFNTIEQHPVKDFVCSVNLNRQNIYYEAGKKRVASTASKAKQNPIASVVMTKSKLSQCARKLSTESSRGNHSSRQKLNSNRFSPTKQQFEQIEKSEVVARDEDECGSRIVKRIAHECEDLRLLERLRAVKNVVKTKDNKKPKQAKKLYSQQMYSLKKLRLNGNQFMTSTVSIKARCSNEVGEVIKLGKNLRPKVQPLEERSRHNLLKSTLSHEESETNESSLTIKATAHTQHSIEEQYAGYNGKIPAKPRVQQNQKFLRASKAVIAIQNCSETIDRTERNRNGLQGIVLEVNQADNDSKSTLSTDIDDDILILHPDEDDILSRLFELD